MKFRPRANLVAIALFLCCVNGWADTVSLPLTDDSFILGVRPTGNYGTWDDIFVTSYGPKQGLVRFDSASIAGQEVNSATLNLYLNDIAAGGTISIHAVTSSWSESTVNWDNQPQVEANATAVVVLATADEGSVISVDVTDTVTRWADGSLADAGFLIVTTDNIKGYFDAKEMAGGTPATLDVDTGPALPTGEAIVLDFSDRDNCTIDEPGFYILDRSWQWVGPNGQAPQDDAAQSQCETVDFYASATLDMRGFSLSKCCDEDTAKRVVTVWSGNVTIRNGTVFRADGFEAIAGTQTANVRLENIYAGGDVDLGEGTHIVNSVMGGGYVSALTVGSNSVITNTEINGGASFFLWQCLDIRGTSIIMRNNTIDCNSDSVLAFNVSDGIFESNHILTGGLIVTGDRNIIARNIINYVDGIATVGTGNILDGNIVLNGGMDLGLPGNYYGDNRVSGSFTSTEGQTDWGGNVTF